MRLLTIGILLSGLVAGGCNRAETGAAASTSAGAAADSNAAVRARASDGVTAAAPERMAPAATSGIARDVTIPAGTHLPIVLDTTVGSDISRVDQPVTAHLARPLVMRGETVLPAGTRVSGIVTDATRSARVKGRAHVAVRFDSLSPHGEGDRYQIRTTAVGRTAPGTKKKDALEIAAPAAGGALIGGLIGGKKGALIGTAAGGGAGTAIVLSTRGKEVRLNRGAALTLRLSEPVTVKVKG